MTRRWLLGSSLLAGATAMCGCGADRPLAALADPRLVPAIAAAGAGPVDPDGVARAQMPDGKQALKPMTRPIDQPPERSADIAGAPPVARIIATVNGEAVLEEEVRAASFQSLAYAAQLPESERRQEMNKIVNAALAQIVDREVVLQDMNDRLKKNAKIVDKLKTAANKEFEHQVLKVMRESGKFKDDAEFGEYFRSQGLSLDLVRRQWERNFMAMEYLRNRVFDVGVRVDHLDVRSYYDAHPDDFKVDDNVLWQDLFVAASKHPSRDAAQAYAVALAGRVQRGEDFVQLAQQYDNGDSSLRKNAEGIGRKQNEVKPPEAAETLFRLKEGEVAVVGITTGFHVVRVVKREHAGLLPFDEKLQKQIREKLRNEVMQREMKRIVADLKRKAIVEYAGGRE